MATGSVITVGDNALPWVEKYRPAGLDDVVAQGDIITTIKKFAKEDKLPHLLFYGPAGVGKTSTILALAKTMYTPSEFNAMVLELNASDDRGIGVVRNEILTFASTRTMFSGCKLKLIILDEADSMTKDAQNALRRIIEKFTDNVRFCIICNYLNKIIPALQSRCTRFRFAPLDENLMVEKLSEVAAAESVSIDAAAVEAMVKLSEGDMRRSINILQSTHLGYDQVTETAVYSCVAHPAPSEVQQILHWLLNSDFAECASKITKLKADRGFALQEILAELLDYILRITLPQAAKIKLVDELSQVEYRLSKGTSEKMQLSAVIAAFIQLRDITGVGMK